MKHWCTTGTIKSCWQFGAANYIYTYIHVCLCVCWATLHKTKVALFCAALSFSNTLFHHFYSQQTLLLALNTLVRMLNYVSAPLGCNLLASPHKVLTRLLKFTNFHGNKVRLQWDHIASYHSVMVPTRIPAGDCCYSDPDKLAGAQSV